MMDARLRVRIAWGTAPYAASPTWDTITDDVLSVTAKTCNRTSEYDSFRAGEATITLQDFAREYDPTYSSSPHAGGFTFGCPITVEGLDGATWRYVWRGYVWRFTPHHAEGRPTVTLQCRDLLAMLAGHQLTEAAATGTGDTPADRIATVHAAVNSALTALEDLDGSSTTLLATTYGRTALAEATRAAQAAGGLYYCEPTGGTLSFEDRHGVATRSRMTTSQRTFGTGGPIDILDGSLKVEGVGDLFRNTVEITREGTDDTLTAGTVGATASERAVARTLPIETNRGAQATADFLADLYGTETPAPIAWSSVAHHATAAYDDDTLRVRLRDRVTVAWSPIVGSTESHDVFVNGITHRITPAEWRVSYTGEAAAAYDDNLTGPPADWLIWGTDVWGTGKWGY